MKGKTTTVGEILKKVMSGKYTVIDNSCNGKCTACGECCTNFLPITQEELNIIAEYVINNKIRPQKQLFVMENKLTCPYYNGKKCLIYDVRPLICKEFYCYKKPTLEAGKKLTAEKRVCVDMWAVANDIDKYIKN